MLFAPELRDCCIDLISACLVSAYDVSGFNSLNKCERGIQKEIYQQYICLSVCVCFCVCNVVLEDRRCLSAIKAKFYYTILFAYRSEAGRRPIADLLARC